MVVSGIHKSIIEYWQTVRFQSAEQLINVLKLDFWGREEGRGKMEKRRGERERERGWRESFSHVYFSFSILTCLLQ